MSSLAEQEILHRIHSLQSEMVRNRLDGALVVQRTDLFYLSGTGQDGQLFIPAKGDPILFVRKNLERATGDSPLKSVRPLRSLSELTSEMSSTSHGPLRNLGMELDVLPVLNYRVYQKLLPNMPIMDVSPLIRKIRMIKSPYELEIMRQAVRVNDSVFNAVGAMIRDGMSEGELSGLLESIARKNGHQGCVRVRDFNNETYFMEIRSGARPDETVCSGNGGSGKMPGGALSNRPGSRIIRRKEPVHIHLVSVIEGYTVVHARTFVVGKPTRELLHTQEIAMTIQNAIAEEGAPGVRAEKFYATARRIASEEGLLDDLVQYGRKKPFIGYGVGLELVELPTVGSGSDHILEPGMVIALESKFRLAGGGTTGIVNSYLVNERGLQKLASFDDTIQIVH